MAEKSNNYPEDAFENGSGNYGLTKITRPHRVALIYRAESSILSLPIFQTDIIHAHSASVAVDNFVSFSVIFHRKETTDKQHSSVWGLQEKNKIIFFRYLFGVSNMEGL